MAHLRRCSNRRLAAVCGEYRSQASPSFRIPNGQECAGKGCNQIPAWCPLPAQPTSSHPGSVRKAASSWCERPLAQPETQCSGCERWLYPAHCFRSGLQPAVLLSVSSIPQYLSSTFAPVLRKPVLLRYETQQLPPRSSSEVWLYETINGRPTTFNRNTQRLREGAKWKIGPP